MTKDETAEIRPPVRTVYGPSAYTVHPGSVDEVDTFPSGMQLKLQLRRLLLGDYKLAPKNRAQGLTEWGVARRLARLTPYTACCRWRLGFKIVLWTDTVRRSFPQFPATRTPKQNAAPKR